MHITFAPRLVSKMRKARRNPIWARLPLCLALTFTIAHSQEPSQQSAQPLSSISAAEFSRLSQAFSEPGGYFRSDNFTSNENAYLHIVDKLQELGVSGGAYIGVGPD